MGYNAAPVATLPATGFALGGTWLALAIVTMLVLGLALMRLRPKEEA